MSRSVDLGRVFIFVDVKWRFSWNMEPPVMDPGTVIIIEVNQMNNRRDIPSDETMNK